MNEIRIEHKKISDLIPAPYNPRKDLQPGDKDYEKLKRSLTEFGLVEPIIVNEYTGLVVGGHQRLKVLKDLGEAETDCVVVNLPPEREKVLNVALNKINGDWDLEKLDELMEDLKNLDVDVTLTGFDLDDDIFKSKDEVEEDDFDVEEELLQPVFSQLGDLWFLGKHRVFCGDSTLPETYERLMEGEKANLLLTDPPYPVSFESKATGSIKNDDLNDEQGYIFLRAAFECFKENLAKVSSAYVFYASAKSRVFYDAFEDAGFRVFCGLVWRKNRAVMSRGDFNHNFEPIIYGTLKDGSHKWYGDQKQTTCFDFDTIKNSKDDGFGHPTSKPIPLMGYLIKQSTLENSIVLDGFHGSGSTMIACEQLGRICRAVELDAKFVDVEVNRFIKLKGGSTDDVYVIRKGQKMAYEEVIADMSHEE